MLTVFLAIALLGDELPQGPGLASAYSADSGVGSDPAVVFHENFEHGSLDSLRRAWSSISNKEGKVLEFSEEVAETGTGQVSLRMTATRGENEGGHLFRVLKPGYDRLFLRFYVRFAPDNGFNHHFVSLGGEIDPPPYPVGRAGLKPEDRWNTGIEPVASSYQTSPYTPFPPPGIWHFYTYWPEMRSWQSAGGAGSSFYGNDFEPRRPVPAPRGEWICVEIMVKMNTAPETPDGEQALWIDGKLQAHFGPGTVRGRWFRDIFLNQDDGEPFEGLRWRTDARVNINKLWLSHYVSETAFERSSAYAAAHPETEINTSSNTVWFDDIVLATEYIGPARN